jgi:hypothetical protein
MKDKKDKWQKTKKGSLFFVSVRVFVFSNSGAL